MGSLHDSDLVREKEAMNSIRRTKIVTVSGMLVANIASVFAIMNRTIPFRFEDLVALVVLNVMFLGFFGFAATRMGSRDLKSIAENRIDQDSKNKN